MSPLIGLCMESHFDFFEEISKRGEIKVSLNGRLAREREREKGGGGDGLISMEEARQQREKRNPFGERTSANGAAHLSRSGSRLIGTRKRRNGYWNTRIIRF